MPERKTAATRTATAEEVKAWQEHVEECAEIKKEDIKEKKELRDAISKNTEMTTENCERLGRIETYVDVILEGAPAQDGKPRIIGHREVSRTFLAANRFIKWFGSIITAILLAILGALFNAMFVAHQDSEAIRATDERMLQVEERMLEALEGLKDQRDE